mmetsp:Transcript_25411/g.84971  ORF Transcript_25411/g.84971 Transcript_25411/m.84971 type:complete len:381 (+) Transcript_25411:132-1274(+)
MLALASPGGAGGASLGGGITASSGMTAAPHGMAELAGIQNAWAAAAVRTSNAALQLHQLMKMARQLHRVGAFAAGAASSPGMGMGMAASYPTVGGQSQGSDYSGMAAAAHMQHAQMQHMASEEEMQRMQIAMQMQMSAATELQTREESMKRLRDPSPLKDSGKFRRGGRHGEKETTEYFYDMAKADEESCVGTSELVKKVKIIQRSSARGYNAWDSYCLSKGNKTKDPRLHHDDFLQGFCDAISRGEYGDVPGAVAILGEGAARKFTPEAPTNDDRNEKPYPKAVFIAGLPKHTTEQDLSEHFTAFGQVSAVRLKFDADGTFRGIGEVEFIDEASAKRVLDNFDYNIFQGRWINCMVAKRKGILGRNPKWWSGTGRETAV